MTDDQLPDSDIKYPIDDLDERLAFDGASRPRLKEEEGIENGFLGDVMSTWTFLNVFGGRLHLDTFTLDDYIDALRYQEVDYPCELIVEIHCALLKALVSEEEPECLVPLPTAHHTSKPAKNGTHEPEPMDVVKIEDDGVSDQGTITTSTSASHDSLYSSLLDIRSTATKSGNQTWQDWRLRIQSRDFLAGGWEYALMGILDELGDSPRLTPVVLDILEELLPEGEKHTRKQAKENYARMDAKFKCKAIALLIQLVCQTPTVREFIEESMGQMTELRKEKVEVQRERKAKIEELALLEAELQPFTPEESVDSQEDSDETTTEMTEIVVQKRSVKASLKRKREEEAAAAEEAAALAKRNKEYAKRIKAIQAKRTEIKDCEERVVNYDQELRERDCQRLRLVGKDRFFNRYWVLEGNGLSQNEIRGEAPFMSARLWVQGPSVEDATFFLGGAGVDLGEFPYGRVSAVDTSIVPEDSSIRDRVLARKEREEGQSVLYDECQWGYYDDQESVEGLIAWLNPKGIREAKLRQAIISRKDELSRLMEARDKVPPTKQPTASQISFNLHFALFSYSWESSCLTSSICILIPSLLRW